MPDEIGRRAWRTDIQGLRGIAVVAVIAHHAGLPLSGGFVGVDAFFVISGYVVAQMLLREWQVTGRLRDALAPMIHTQRRVIRGTAIY